jgi:hypothetical protein
MVMRLPSSGSAVERSMVLLSYDEFATSADFFEPFHQSVLHALIALTSPRRFCDGTTAQKLGGCQCLLT